jgi:hypothetical protein
LTRTNLSFNVMILLRESACPSHAEPGMKRNYAERDWARLKRALLEMERTLFARDGISWGESA